MRECIVALSLIAYFFIEAARDLAFANTDGGDCTPSAFASAEKTVARDNEKEEEDSRPVAPMPKPFRTLLRKAQDGAAREKALTALLGEYTKTKIADLLYSLDEFAATLSPHDSEARNLLFLAAALPLRTAMKSGRMLKDDPDTAEIFAFCYRWLLRAASNPKVAGRDRIYAMESMLRHVFIYDQVSRSVLTRGLKTLRGRLANEVWGERSEYSRMIRTLEAAIFATAENDEGGLVTALNAKIKAPRKKDAPEETSETVAEAARKMRAGAAIADLLIYHAVVAGQVYGEHADRAEPLWARRVINSLIQPKYDHPWLHGRVEYHASTSNSDLKNVRTLSDMEGAPTPDAISGFSDILVQ